MILKIRYKALKHERTEDSPFVGCLISSIDCNFNCKGCFNQHVKKEDIITKEDTEIINEIKSNPFNKGIIFGGLEWTLQHEELIILASYAKENELQTILYTGNRYDDMKIFMQMYGQYFDYIKCGRYEEENKTVNHIEYGVTLASNNQHIYKKGIDY
jgi:pyruvate-formate lyase-activating enzyme